MNLGLGNLIELKRQLLAPALIPGTNHDALITALGNGIAAAFDTATNRKLARQADDTATFRADCDHFVLPRYPIESISSIEQQNDYALGFAALAASTVWQVLPASGLVQFGSSLGSNLSLVRITYTGGYWSDVEEDEARPQPAGTIALPADLKLAWYLQARHTWQSIDKTGANVLKPEKGPLEAFDLVPEVKAILQKYVRYQMT